MRKTIRRKQRHSTRYLEVAKTVAEETLYDPAKAIEKTNEIDKLIWAEVHSITSYQRPDIWAAKKNLANMGAYGFASIVYEDIGWMADSDAAASKTP